MNNTDINNLANVVSSTVTTFLDNRLEKINSELLCVNNNLNDYINVANEINTELSIFKARDKQIWSSFIDSSLKDLGVVRNSSQDFKNAREFVKNIILPNGTWESVVVTDMFDGIKFKKQIVENCILCKQAHPEWFKTL